MKLLTFVGTGNYEVTEYAFANQTRTTAYSLVATSTFFEVDEIVIFATEQARDKHGTALQSDMTDASPLANLRFAEVPAGNDEAQLWNLFRTIAESVSEPGPVVLDITHGFRSQPLVGLLATAYLQSLGRIQLEAILYGAYEARDQSVTPHRTPMFDLTPMLDLLKWATAADRFRRFGDAADLADLLRAHRQKCAREAQGNPEILSAFRGFDGAVNNLEDVTLSLNLSRPFDVLKHAASVPGALEKVKPGLQQSAGMRPFELVSDEILKAFEPFALADPTDPGNVVQALDIQREMVSWYVERRQIIQAMTLAREWLVSWVMLHNNTHDLCNRESREKAEKSLNNAAHAARRGDKEMTSEQEDLPAVSQLDTVAPLWNGIAQLRNDLNHAGMRAHPLSARAAVKKATEFAKELTALNLPEV